MNWRSCAWRGSLGGGSGLSEEPFRFRGVRVVVDTVETAEFDIRLYDVPDATVERIGRSLAKAVQLAGDRAIGNFMIREIDGYDVVFIVGREGQDIVATIGRIRPADPQNPTEEVLRNLSIVAIFRSATGI